MISTGPPTLTKKEKEMACKNPVVPKPKWPNTPEFVEESDTGTTWYKGEMYPSMDKKKNIGSIIVKILGCIGFIVYSIVLLYLGSMLV